MLAAADAGDLIRGHHDEHAAQFGKPGDDGASRQAGLYLRAPLGGAQRAMENPFAAALAAWSSGAKPSAIREFTECGRHSISRR
jgi:hypothetical protein